MVVFKEVKDIESMEFEEAMNIYTESFPSNERHAAETIRERMEKDLYRMYVGIIEDAIAFMALLYPLKGANFILFDYMATKKEYRNRGMGTEFVRNVMALVEGEFPDSHLILEVENPRYGNNKEERIKRVDFYRRLGAKELSTVEYVLPPLSGALPTDMILMILPEYDAGRIEGALVRRLIVQIYRELYNRNEDDRYLDSFIHKIDETIELI